MKGISYNPYSCNMYVSPSVLDVNNIVPVKWAYEYGGADWKQEIKRGVISY